MSDTTGKWVFEKTENILKYYKILKNLGQPGQFGRAVLADRLQADTPDDPKKGWPKQVAIKIVNKTRFLRNSMWAVEIFSSFRTEVEVLKRMNHPNVIRYFEYFEDESDFYIVTELCPGGELFDRLAKGPYSEKEAAGLLRQMFEAVAYLHKSGIAHCDLKPDNFLFSSNDKDAKLKVIDFGMSKFVHRRYYFKKFCGTPYYVAPEVIDKKYDESCDLWSLGVVMFVMLHGFPPFHGSGPDGDAKILGAIKGGFINEVRKGFGPWFPATLPISDQGRDLIAKLLVKDIKKRLTAQEALEHPWLSGNVASDKPLHVSVLNSLKAFTKMGKFKEVVLNSMVQSLNDTEIAVLKQSFASCDADHDGSITVEELRKAVGLMDSKMGVQDIERILKNADVDGNGVLSYEELCMAFVQRKLNNKEERLWDTFCKFDRNHDGKITVEELQQALSDEDKKKAKEIVAEIDKDGNGTIDYDEFLTMFLGPDDQKEEAKPAPMEEEKV